MAGAVKSIGLPWVHSGVVCTGCQVNPITGYRYKCETCVEHDLCEKCFRLGHPQMGHKFLRIARDSNNFHPPFQVYYIVCDECGQGPIEGRRYLHKWRPNYNLCNGCFTRLQRPGFDASREFEAIDEVKIQTIFPTHIPVYHFHKQCGSCGITPICGPRFDSLVYMDYSLCLVCFDTKFVKRAIKNDDYIRIERPEPVRVRQIAVYSCMSCGDAPICGPAYVHQRLPEKIYCILCYMNVPRQFEYSRVEAPSQFGEPPAPAFARQTPLVTGGSVRHEDYENLAQKFELYRKEKEEKEEAARVVAKKYMELTEKFEQYQQRAQGSGSFRQQELVAKEHEKYMSEIEALKKQKDDDAEYATRIYVSRIEALEAIVAEKEAAVRKTEATYAALNEELEKLNSQEKGKTTESNSLARVKSVDGERAETKASDSSLSLEFEKLKMQLLSVTQELEKSKEREEEMRTIAVKHNELVEEHLNLTEEFDTIKKEKEVAERNCEQKSTDYTALKEEVARLKLEKEEAVEYASLAKELDSLDVGKEETVTAEKYTSLSSEFEKLKKEHTILTQEFENFKEEVEEISRRNGKKYDDLMREHLSLTSDFNTLKEEKEEVVQVHAQQHMSHQKEILCHKEEKEEVVQQLEEKYTILEEELSRHKEEKEEAIRVHAEKNASLEEELLICKKEKEEDAKMLAKFQEENEKRKDEAVEWADLIEQFQGVIKDKEAVAAELDMRVKELEQLVAEKEADVERKANDYVVIYDEFDALHKEYDKLRREMELSMRTNEERYENLKLDFEKYREDKEVAEKEWAQECDNERRKAAEFASNVKDLQVKEEEGNWYVAKVAELEGLLKEKEIGMKTQLEDHEHLVQELEGLKKDLEKSEETARVSRREFLDLSEDFGNYKEEIEGEMKARAEEHAKLLQENEEVKNENAQLIDDINSLEESLKETEAAIESSAAAYALAVKEVEVLKEGLEIWEEEKRMAAADHSVAIQELETEVKRLEKLVLEKEEVARAISEKFSILSVEFERYKKEKIAEVEESSLSRQLYANLAQNLDKSKKDKIAGGKVNMEDFKRLQIENEELKEEIQSVKEDFDELFPKYRNLCQSKVTKDDYERVKTELEKLKASVLDIPGVGKCATAAICTYGVIVEKKKVALEEGLQKSRLQTKDQDILRQSVEFMNDAVKDLDREFSNFMEEVIPVTDEEAEEFFLTMNIETAGEASK